MGHLIYGVAPAIEIEDWTLQHLRAVIVTKLRRDESFVFTWENESAIHGDDAIEKSGRYGSVWISKASPLYFSFDGPLKDPLNLRWLQQLADAAQSSTGLRPLEEPSGEGAPHPHRRRPEQVTDARVLRHIPCGPAASPPPTTDPR